MNWTEVEDKIITDNRGVIGATQIAALIGVSRNAVIGRSHRLGLINLRSAPRVKVPKPRRRTKPVKVFVSPPVPVVPLNIPFGELERHHCREIVGTGDYGLSLSCGHPKNEDSSYCRWHHVLNHYTRPERTVVPLAA